MTIKQLKYFNTLCKYKNFTKAAEKLFLSQSTLSKSISMLEEDFRIEFINRRAKEFELTEHGKIFYQFSMKIINIIEKEQQILLKKLSLQNLNLKLGLPPSAGTIYFSKKIFDFKTHFPNISLEIKEITSKNIVKEIENGSLDLGIVIEPFNDNKFQKWNVLTSEAVLVTSNEHKLSKLNSINFKELQNEPVIMISPDYMFYDNVKKKFKEAGIIPNFFFESYSWDLILTMVLENEGVTIFPLPLIEKIYKNKLNIISLKNPSFSWGLSLICKKEIKLTYAMKKFIELCKTNT